MIAVCLKINILNVKQAGRKSGQSCDFVQMFIFLKTILK